MGQIFRRELDWGFAVVWGTEANARGRCMRLLTFEIVRLGHLQAVASHAVTCDISLVWQFRPLEFVAHGTRVSSFPVCGAVGPFEALTESA